MCLMKNKTLLVHSSYKGMVPKKTPNTNHRSSDLLLGTSHPILSPSPTVPTSGTEDNFLRVEMSVVVTTPFDFFLFFV
jgi:hypothetical protein